MNIKNIKKRFGRTFLCIPFLSISLATTAVDGYMVYDSIKIEQVQAQNVDVVEPTPTPTPEVVQEIEVVKEPIVVEPETAIFVTTAYCAENYPHICNNGDASTTATGTTPTPGRTIAVDPKVIPYGSEVIIDGHTYIAEDCGGAIKGNRIDILFATHQQALEWGRQTKEVIIKK